MILRGLLSEDLHHLDHSRNLFEIWTNRIIEVPNPEEHGNIQIP